MATWHAALFFEMEKVHDPGFPLSWPLWLQVLSLSLYICFHLSPRTPRITLARSLFLCFSLSFAPYSVIHFYLTHISPSSSLSLFFSFTVCYVGGDYGGDKLELHPELGGHLLNPDRQPPYLGRRNLSQIQKKVSCGSGFEIVRTWPLRIKKICKKKCRKYLKILLLYFSFGHEIM